MNAENIAEIIKENAYEIAVEIKVAEELIKKDKLEGKSLDIMGAVAYDHIIREIFGKEYRK